LTYQLLDRFEALFQGRPYLHRVSTHGDAVAMRLFEDLYDLKRSPSFVRRADSGLCVLNTKNNRHGVKARRGDGSFGEIVPGIVPIRDADFNVGRGPLATIEIGVEVKILAKAMIKQIDRVISDLGKQVAHFKAKGGTPIAVGIVGINWAEHYCSFEGDRIWPTDGGRYKHPVQEAADAENRLMALAAPHFDEFITLNFIATNESPYDFRWKNARSTAMDYAAVLARVSAAYERAVR